MPRFLLKFKLDRKPNRGRPDETLERARIVLGSRPLADVYVADRLVPQEAVAFEFDGSRARIEVLGTLAGVFVNGVPAGGAGVVPPGAAIQVGHTLVEVSIDAAQQVCTLTVGEQYLRKTVEEAAKKAQASFALVEEGPQEQRWGKSPHVRRWSWAATFAGLAALLGSYFLRESDAMSRGELHRTHAIGAPHGPDNCSSCHDPFVSDYEPMCAKCHEGYAGDAGYAHHPGVLSREYGCAECHGDHRGADADLIPPMTVGAGGWPETCARCHDGGTLDEKVAAAAADPALPSKAKDRPGAAVERWLQVDGFSHADHRVAKPRRVGLTGTTAAPEGTVPVPCAECHERAAAPDAARPGAEFAGVPYEKCLECHAEWRVDVHGRDQGGVHCFQCHVRTDDLAKIPKDIRTAAVPLSTSMYELPPRRHDFAKDDCRACHVVEKSGQPRSGLVVLAFRHDHHLRTVTPTRGAELDLAATCVPCHKGVAEGDSLAGLGASLPRADLSVCGTCHTDGDPKPLPTGKSGATHGPIVDMAHAVHVVEPGVQTRGGPKMLAGRESLAQGCLSCHVPVAGTERMGLREGAKDCTACHAGHEHLGEGKCVLCHVDRASAANRDAEGGLVFRTNDPGIFDRAKATVKRTNEVRGFDHFSPGHAEPASDPTGAGCADCHDAAATDASQRVLDVPWPGHADRTCVACHVRTRFHR